MVAKDQAVTRVGMPLDEFIRRFDVEGPFELIDGEAIPKMPNVFIHVIVLKRLLALLLAYEQSSSAIQVFPEQTCCPKRQLLDAVSPKVNTNGSERAWD